MDLSSSPMISMSSASGLSTSVVVVLRCDECKSLSMLINDNVILLLRITAGSSGDPIKSSSVTSSVWVSESATRIWDFGGSEPSRYIDSGAGISSSSNVDWKKTQMFISLCDESDWTHMFKMWGENRCWWTASPFRPIVTPTSTEFHSKNLLQNKNKIN